MDSSKKYSNPSPELKANIVSRIFYCWLLPFFKYGYKNDLQAKDVYSSVNDDLSGPLGDELERQWEAEIVRTKGTKERPSLLRAIRHTFLKPYSFYGFLIFCNAVVLRTIQPVILAFFIRYFDATRFMELHTGWLLAFGVTFTAFINMTIMHWSNINTQRIGMRCKIACCSLIYRKLLRLNHTSIGNTPAGQLINLMSNDVQRFDMASVFLHFIWIMPIQAVVACVLMYQAVGYAVFAGFGAIILQAIPLQGYLSKLQGIFRYKIAQKTDNRVKLMNEITSGIQVIKMYAWEKPFEKMVDLARKHEIKIISKTSYIRGFSTALMVFTERTILYLTVITYVLMGNRLTGDIVFSIAQLFNSVQLYMCILYPLGASAFAEARTSIKRIEDFLLQEENKTEAIEKIPPPDECGAIKMSHVNASWLPNPIVDTLIDLNLDIKPGTLCCVVGPVGCGKSSLLQVVNKELPIISGKMLVNGEISYASQEPWLFVSSVRNNILFGEPYHKSRYKQIVNVCALEKDFEQFTNGDRTMVGERGVSMSGGQRARINLARAVYREADIYLFDDPLSAVDTHVGKHLFEKCLVEYLRGKTRILVTHQLQFLKGADLIVIIINGKIDKVCTYNELTPEELDILNQEAQQAQSQITDTPEKVPKQRVERLMSVTSVSSTLVDEDEFDEPEETQELMEKGAIPTSTYLDYFKSGGSIAVLLFLILLLILAQAACNASDCWLTYWTNQEEIRYNMTHIGNTTSNLSDSASIMNDAPAIAESLDLSSTLSSDTLETTTLVNELTSIFPSDNSSEIASLNNTVFNSTVLNGTTTESIWSQNIYIYIYTVLIIFSIVLTTFRSLLFFKICMNASRALHNTMFSNVLKAPMRFFDTNPSGRILNRFSKDMGAIDELLPRSYIEAIQIFLVMAGILVMVFIVTPWMIAPAVVLGVVFYFCRVVYLSTAQDVKRVEGITRAPVFSHVTATLYGLPTIRTSHAQNLITDEFDTLQDQHTGSMFLYYALSESFGFYLDLISVVFLTIVTFQFILLDDGTTLSGNVGLVISQSLILTGMLQYGVRQTAEVASNMTSVERVLQYTKLEKEGPFESLTKPPQNWPSSGRIAFKNMYLRYVKDEPPVLKNLNFEIKAGEKVGVVGRTGAGKSSLIAALFRLSPIEGKIEIDGVDTQTVGLNYLRSKISIIPQEPVLFSASVRYNLDPFGTSDDESLWKALESVELKDSIESLDQRVSEGGSNFSAGQRQLMCLARAIIRNNKILVMDEATANVDPITDGLIQSTIRKNFESCTVITIAHRLNTIMDSDKVLVMNTGEAVEFAHPHELLQDPEGHFAKMVEQTGPAMEARLKGIAEGDYVKKYGSKIAEMVSNKKND